MHGNDGALLLVSLTLLLCVAKVLALVARRLGQPVVVGEIGAGVLLGPTVMGHFAPQQHLLMFPTGGSRAAVFDGLNLLGIVLFLFVAGAEIDVAGVARRARPALAVALGGMALPMLVGLGTALLWPVAFGWEGRAERWVFALFVGTALCISALPVIAKTLMDLGLYRTDLGMTVIASAVINDIVGWVLFAFILSSIPGAAASGGVGRGLIIVGLMAILYIGGRPLIHRLLAFVYKKSSDPSAALAVMMPLVLGGAAFTEHFGLHAMFGAFVVGATAAGSPHFREQTRAAMADFVSVLFSPLFFASIGLHVDFLGNFDAKVVLLVLAVACIGKVLGCFGGARLASLERRESWAIGAAMNARGAMEIVLASVALDVGLIGSRTFVALVTMALVTSMLSAPAIRRLFPRRERRRVVDVLEEDTFVPTLAGTAPAVAIAALADVAAARTHLAAAALAQAVVARERIVSTALGNGVAVPHARIEGLEQTVVALGISAAGVPFDAPDGNPVHVVVMVLTPLDDHGEQLEILADVARIFSDPANERAVREAPSFAAVRAILRGAGAPKDKAGKVAAPAVGTGYS